MRWLRSNAPVVLASGLALSIFIIDLATPPSAAVWFLYLIPVAVTYRASYSKTPFFFAGICTALIILDFHFNDVDALVLIINSFIGSSLLWLTAVVLVQRKRAEESLRTSGERYRSLFEHMLEGFAYCKMIFENDQPRDFIYLDVNRAFTELTGLRNVVGKKVSEVIPGIRKSDPVLFEAYGRVALTGKPERFEIYVHALGIWFSISVYSPGKEYFVAVFENITERKRAEDALKESERLLRKSQVMAGLGSYALDITTGRWKSSLVLDDIFGIDAHFIRSVEGWASLIHPEHREWMVDYFTNEVIGKSTRFDMQYRIVRHNDGQERWVHGLGELEFDAQHRPIKMIGTIQDITERKQTEEALRESETKFRSLAEQSLVGVVIIQEGQFKYVNPALVRMMGYSQAELLAASSVLEFITEEDHALVRENLRRREEGESQSINYSFRVRRKDGALLDFEVFGSGVSFQGRPAVMSTILDVTERKRAEEALKLFRELIDQSNDAVEVIDPETGRFLDLNEKAWLDLGYTREELLSLRVFEVDPTVTRATFTTSIEELRKSGYMIWNGYHRRKDGSVFPVEVNIKFVQLDRGYVVTVVRDITERNRSEKALKEAEEKYRNIFEGVPIGIYQSTIDGTYLAVNYELARILGYESPEELIAGTSDLHTEFYVKPGRRAEFIRKIREDSVVSGFESQAYRKDRSIIWVSENARSLYDEHGVPSGFEGTMTDITSRKTVEESMKRLLWAVEQTKDIVFMTDVSGKITFANPSFEFSYGYTREEALGNTPRILRSGLQGAAFYTMFWDTILSGQNIRAEFINKTKDGKLLTMESTVSPMFDSDLGLTGFIAVQRDVTLERENEQERKALEGQLFQAQKLESIGTLAGGIAHDFNNVLAIILGYTTLLERFSGDSEKVSKSVEAISGAVQRGTDLVKQILMFSRKSEVTFEPLDVNRLVAEIQKMAQETFPRNITVTTSLDPRIPMISADGTQMHQVLLNLCVNARDAMPDGGTLTIATKRVMVEELRKRIPDAEGTEFTKISVHDTGEGMDEVTKQRIFEPFFTTKEVGKGTGLGLSVVYGIIKSHHGYVAVESEPGKGTTFDLYFPMMSTSRATDEHIVEQPTAIAGGTETILFIEDEAMLRELLKASLEASGYGVLTASDGADALKLYKKHHQEITLVISDLGLPKMDGARIFSEFKKINPQVKFFIASGYVDPGVKSGFLKAGAKGFLQKPYRPAEILEAIREILDAD